MFCLYAFLIFVYQKHLLKNASTILNDGGKYVIIVSEFHNPYQYNFRLFFPLTHQPELTRPVRLQGPVLSVRLWRASHEDQPAQNLD
jgi:hypothetical protein